jgi:sugar transferase (PEP-CTERM/EpsH1 system associated)
VKILFLVSRVPYPLEKGDKLRAFNHLKLLSEKHEITLVALNDTELHPDAEQVLSHYCKRMHILDISFTVRVLSLISAAFNGKPFSTGYFYNKIAQDIIDDIIDEIHPAHIYCQLTRVTEYVKNRNDITKTLDYQDAFAKGMEKRISKEPFYLHWLFKMEYKRLLKYESEVFDWFDNKIIISAQDRENIAHNDKQNIVVVPNGVDLDYFQPRQSEKKYDLLFTGNMSYPPNVESVVFLVNKVLPFVKQQKPNIKLLIAGATPVKRVKDLQNSNVEVSGWVDDMRECYAATKLFIAPMQISIGLQNKLLEAMAMKVPCITSELANNALQGTHSENIIVCKQPQEYADAILRLLDNYVDAEQLATAGHDFVKLNYGWKKMTEPLISLIES